jgi:hypothetical protein
MRRLVVVPGPARHRAGAGRRNEPEAGLPGRGGRQGNAGRLICVKDSLDRVGAMRASGRNIHPRLQTLDAWWSMTSTTCTPASIGPNPPRRP